jgi:hypothetical protein
VLEILVVATRIQLRQVIHPLRRDELLDGNSA